MLVRVSFGIRLPNGLAPSSPRPKASVSLPEFRCAVYTFRKVWLSKSRQWRSGRDTFSLCSSTIQSSARMQKHRYHGDESKFAGKLQKSMGHDMHIHDSQNQWISHLKIVNQFTGGQYVNLVPQEHTVLRHCDVLDRQSNVTLMKNVVEVHFCGCKAAN